jgi:hypothetical protein
MPPLPIVLGLKEVSGSFDRRYQATGFLMVTEGTRNRARNLVIKELTGNILSYLAESGLFEKVVREPSNMNVDLHLECELSEYEARSTITSGSVVLATRGYPRTSFKSNIVHPK